MPKCKACNKEIYFLKTKNGKFIPVNAESLNASELYDLKNKMQRLFDPKKHITHFTDCPAANKFRK